MLWHIDCLSRAVNQKPISATKFILKQIANYILSIRLKLKLFVDSIIVLLMSYFRSIAHNQFILNQLIFLLYEHKPTENNKRTILLEY
ncbi:TPA: hypothetical protein JBG74_00175 [Legionella pneumophila]|uniref:Uncharacterized protein n=1 Tax=Legionella pneumophila TaxID=446 RepID=A0AAN5PHT0_LEGPN|nr:hypothetical protein A6J41_007465 [Legionella pneumophila subsp. pneumophila]PPK33096.1 hypothetical protein C3927_08680 [Legionella pneumophila]PYB51915.1 hypothetical protein DM459_08990 [Legionella pneumophila]PYB56138.1 hypothetical protein DM457_08990 [Legionella pneumophila]PYB61739.1 hypothetical protein DM458_03860 [Legionella pneumophila]